MHEAKQKLIVGAALLLAVLVCVPLVQAREPIFGGIESCFRIYRQKVADADRHAGQLGPGGNFDPDALDEGFREAEDFLIDCILKHLRRHPLARGRLLHVPGGGFPHGVAFSFDNPEGYRAARVWLFTAPLGGEGAGSVPGVVVNGRAVWNGTEPPAAEVLVEDVPLLPGANELTMRCDPADSMAAVLVIEPVPAGE